jgi:hypothetical protein
LFYTLKTSCSAVHNVDWTPQKQPRGYGNLHICTFTAKSLYSYSCCFRNWRRRFCGIDFSISRSGVRNVWEFNDISTVRACTAFWDSEQTEGWYHGGAEQTQRTGDIRWHTGDGLPGHGCVRWVAWSRVYHN